MRSVRLVALVCGLMWGSLAVTSEPYVARDDSVTVITYSDVDAAELPRVFAILQQARRDVRRDWGLTVPTNVTVVVHPDIGSYQAATGMPWFVAGLANRDANRIDVQRLRVLIDRHSLEATLRHELFHLAQPDDLPRWRAEGMAMRFAGEVPQALPFEDVNDAQLDKLLASVRSPEELARAAATAYHRVRCPPCP